MYSQLLKYLAPLVMVSMSIDLSDTILNAGLVISSSGGDTNFTNTSTLSYTVSQSPSPSFNNTNPSSQVSRLAAFGAAHRILRWIWSGSW